MICCTPWISDGQAHRGEAPRVFEEQQPAVPKSPPWIHSTASSNLIPILNEEKLLAVKCNVFQGEKLCYLFVGRAAYKGKDALNPEPWQLPTVFVMRFSNPPPLKRIHPFDTGAFERGRMPD